MVSFDANVISVGPGVGAKGDRLVAVVFGVEEPVATEDKEHKGQQHVVHTLDVPGLPTPPQLRMPIQNRIVVFFTMSEWTDLGKRRPIVGDSYTLSTEKNGFGIKKKG